MGKHPVQKGFDARAANEVNRFMAEDTAIALQKLRAEINPIEITFRTRK